MLTVAHPELTQPVFNEDNIRTSSSSSSKSDIHKGVARLEGTGAGHTQFLWPSNSAAAWSSTCWRASSLVTPLAKVEASA